MRVTARGVPGFAAWRPRIETLPHVFRHGSGVDLYPGTLNVEVGSPLPIQEEFTIAGERIGEPDQDMLFEACLVNGVPGWRLRPHRPATGLGGHGNHMLEIVSARQSRPLIVDLDNVVVEFPNRKWTFCGKASQALGADGAEHFARPGRGR